MSALTDPTPARSAGATAVLGAADADERTFGGKGRSLARLIEARYPVPATGVVTTVAYRLVAGDPSVEALVARIAGGEEVPASEVDATFITVAAPPEVRDAIITMVAEVGGGGPVAIRSSATVEDMEESSFAGQYRSLLDVDANDPEAVMRAVRLVWASLWHPAPAAYRRAFDIDETDVAMAVVVMRMIPATTAGVVFTADPGGQPDAARVESVEGLGEELVSGRRTPKAWVVARDRPDELPLAPRRALELALAIEAMDETPQDVEWAAVGDDVSVVQARPITVLQDDDGFDTPLDDHELTTAGIVEMVPGVLPPLRWELNRLLLEEAFRSVLDSLGLIRGSAAEDRPFVRRVRGRAAIDFDQLRAAASSTPGAAEELEAQYFGEGGGDGPPDALAGGRRSLRRWLRRVRTQRTAVDNAEVVIASVDQLRMELPAPEGLDDGEILSLIERILDVAARGLAAELAVAAIAAAEYRRLELVLGDHLGSVAGASAAQIVTTGAAAGSERLPAASAAVFAGPTWHELEAIPPRIADRDDARDASRLAELERRLRSLPGWTRRRVITGQFVDLRVHLLRRTVAEARDQLRRREQTKAALLELGGMVRGLLLELGRRFVDAGALPQPGDVELLSFAELGGLVSGGAGPGVDVIRRRRNWLGRYEAEGQLPLRFVGVPDREPAPLPAGDVLEGWAASPGRQRGRGQVVTSPTGPLEEGAVLVAEATDASWSPLFVRAGAIVVERGGPLSHAAILARELGIPAVLNVQGATRRLDGALVSVDGDQGLVVIES